jgi:flagellar hook protein FlgE
MSSFSIPLTGLEASSTALDTVANNLSNMNTTAFKSQQASFGDLFYQQIGNSGSGDPLEVGAGVQVAATNTNFAQGSVSATGNATDVALNGSGFFVVQNSDGTSAYTRDGNFTLTSNGDLTTQGGQAVLGYPAANGVVNTNAALNAIQIPVGQVEQPSATQNFGLTANLNSSAAVGTNFTAQVPMYDSLGQPQNVNISFTKTAANTWNYSLALPAGASTGGTGLTGTLQFDSNGNLTSPAANLTGISFTGLTDGASSMSLNWNLYNSNGTGTITQVDTTSGYSATTQDGYPSGQYTGFTIGSDGKVSAQFSNGRTQAVGQLALASITNEQGLKLEGGDLYQTTLASGGASIGLAGSAGLGTVQDSALEGSNVNISTEFSNLVVAQNAYEASSKALTTFDQVAQDTINIIH